MTVVMWQQMLDNAHAPMSKRDLEHLRRLEELWGIAFAKENKAEEKEAA